MIFQEPMTSLNPVLRIGDQITEAVRLHASCRKGSPGSRPSTCLRRSVFPNRNSGRENYPHQLSGGMRQRAMIAMALACRPALLIADEPTTALDVTIQAQILDLLVELKSELGTGLILITHDLGMVAQTAQRVIDHVFRQDGREPPSRTLFENPGVSLHAAPAGIHAAVRRSATSTAAAVRNSRHGAVTDQSATGLRLRAALSAGDRSLPR